MDSSAGKSIGAKLFLLLFFFRQSQEKRIQENQNEATPTLFFFMENDFVFFLSFFLFLGELTD